MAFSAWLPAGGAGSGGGVAGTGPSGCEVLRGACPGSSWTSWVKEHKHVQLIWQNKNYLKESKRYLKDKHIRCSLNLSIYFHLNITLLGA